jgi:hypothetical protein
MSSKIKRTMFTKSMLRDAARAAHRRTHEFALPPLMAQLPGPGKRRDQAALDDRIAWSRASARARRRGLH